VNDQASSAVLDRALELLSTHDLRDISVDHLSEASGVPSFDIIREFRSRERILEAVLNREAKLLVASLPPFENDLPALANALIRGCQTRLPLLRRLLSEASRDKRVAALIHETFIGPLQWLLESFFRDEKNTSRKREDVQLAARLFLNALVGSLIMREVFGGEVEARQLCDAFLHRASMNS
jgi:AcrR family transcriptional regulator